MSVLLFCSYQDLDLGNYERFLGVQLTRDHNITTGKAYSKVIEAERRGEYLGKTVQIVPHVTNAIQDWIERVAKVPVGPGGTGPVPEVCFIELGGTVGDIESTVFLEALRELRCRVGSSNLVYVCSWRSHNADRQWLNACCAGSST